jgi:hypothetical protein
VLKFAIKALTALVDEMFRLGHKTRGGIILMMLFFYSAFVVGMVVWIETDSHEDDAAASLDSTCTSIGECTFLLMRLTFYDGDGFDFAFFLTKDHKILFCIVMFYMAFTGWYSERKCWHVVISNLSSYLSIFSELQLLAYSTDWSVFSVTFSRTRRKTRSAKRMKTATGWRRMQTTCRRFHQSILAICRRGGGTNTTS